jgi:fumarate hydratase class II
VRASALPPAFIRALALVKAAAANSNEALGLLPALTGRFIQAAANEIAGGAHLAQFPLDVFQTGSGTSTNTNANEVIARRADQLAVEASSASGGAGSGGVSWLKGRLRVDR